MTAFEMYSSPINFLVIIIGYNILILNYLPICLTKFKYNLPLISMYEHIIILYSNYYKCNYTAAKVYFCRLSGNEIFHSLIHKYMNFDVTLKENRKPNSTI